MKYNIYYRKNPNQLVQDKVSKAIKDNDGYCPCKLDHIDDNKCMCKEFREQSTNGTCHCGMYEKYFIPNYKYVAVDFDGTLCKHKFPDIGEPNYELIEYLKVLHSYGTKIILYTCREDDEVDIKGNIRNYLSEAISWCSNNNIPIDAVNENPWVSFGGRKIYADAYIDDRNVSIDSFKLK